MNTNASRQECATLIVFVHYVRTELQADAAPMLWLTDSKIPRLLNSLHRGREVHLDSND